MKQKKEARKRKWRRGSQDRSLQSKPWALKEFGGKTLWDWLHLLSALAIPVVLAVIGFWFTAQQDARQQQSEEQRAQDLALQAFLDQMSTLVLEDLDDPKVRTLMRARTLTVLERLDLSRKEEVMQFLIEAELIQGDVKSPLPSTARERPPTIQLANAELSGVDLSGAKLGDPDLRGITDLGGAHLGRADLSDANLSATYLRGADLARADLSDANLQNADLYDTFLVQTDLSRADLSEAYLNGAYLDNANLKDADLRDAQLIEAELIGANFEGADLHQANLYGAVGQADLSRADLSKADLENADLSGADLSGATGWTEKQLTAAKSFEGATMPDGQILKDYLNPDRPTFEDWLKSKGRGEDGDNSGTS